MVRVIWSDKYADMENFQHHPLDQYLFIFWRELNDEIDMCVVIWLVDFWEGFLVTELSLKSEKC